MLKPETVVRGRGRTGVLARRMEMAADVDLTTLAAEPTRGFTGADLDALCRNAAMFALDRAVAAGQLVCITAADWTLARSSMVPSVTAADLAVYADWTR